MDAKSDNEIIDTFDLDKIKRLIPHRYPFLMIDKVHVLERGVAAIGIKNVTNNEPHFTGHFPDKPVMPGVLIIEALAQTAATVAMDVLLSEDEACFVYLTAIEGTKFRQQVVPGDVLELHVRKEKERMSLWRFTAQAKVAGKVATQTSFSAVIEKRPLTSA